MKKIKLFIIIFGIMICRVTLAQEGVVDCGETEIDMKAIMSGEQNSEEIPEIVCLGKQIMTKNSSAKVSLITEEHGNIEFYIERGDDNQFIGKISLGEAEYIGTESEKIYANTFFACPANLGQMELENPNINFSINPGTLVLLAYHKLSSLVLDPVTNACVGTYLSVSPSEEIIEPEEIIQPSKDLIKPEDVIDNRVLFSDLISLYEILEIEDGAKVKQSENILGCMENDTDEEFNCFRYFYGSDKNQYNNPATNLTLKIIKQNKKVDNKYSLLKSLTSAAENYSTLIKSYDSLGYANLSEEVEIEGLNKGYYRKYEKLGDRIIIALKDTWVIEIDYTNDIDEDFIISVIKSISSKINDLEGIDMSGYEAFDFTLNEIEKEEEEGEISEEEAEAIKIAEQEKLIVEENQSLLKRLSGKIVIKVEENGEAYYVDPTSKKIYYLGRPEDAFAMMRDRGIGITSSNLNKISIGLISSSGIDSDGDGLSDIFEDAIKTNKNLADTDGDSYSDKDEIEGGFDPNNGAGKKMNYDLSFSKSQIGKIFLQVEDNGEAWYINPGDSKRYFLGRPNDAFNIMRTFGLGISNKDFASLEAAVK